MNPHIMNTRVLKSIAVSAFILAAGHALNAQNTGVGINITGAATDNSAILDVSASDKGILIPRVALTDAADLTTVPSAANGLLVYNTATAGTAPNNVTPGFYFWDGSAWSRLVNDNGNITADNGLTKTGNNIQLGGTLITPTVIAKNGQNLTISGTGTTALTGGIINMNVGSNFAVNIGTGSTTGAVTLGGTGTQTINVGSSGTTSVKTVNVGSSGAAAHVTNIRSGTTGAGAVNVNTSVNSPTNINTGTSTGNVSIGSDANTVFLGTNNVGSNVNVPKLGINSVVITDASNNLTSVAPGTSGNVLVSNGAAWTSGDASGSFIRNQSAVNQTATFRINGNGIFDGGSVDLRNADSFVGTTTNHSLGIRSDNTDRITVLNTGAVRIGYGTAATDALQVGGYGHTNPKVFMGSEGGAPGYGIIRLQNTATTDNVLLRGVGVSYFNGGNVGIGSTNPGQRLTVVDAGNTNQYSGTFSVFANNLTQGVGIGYMGIQALGSNPNQDLSFNARGTGNIAMQVVGTTGNVGIGIPTPTEKLNVNGSVLLPAGASYWIGNNADAGNRLRMHLSGSEAYVDYASGSLTFRSGTTSRVVFGNNGDVQVVGLSGTGNRPIYADASGVLNRTPPAGQVLNMFMQNITGTAIGVNSTTYTTVASITYNPVSNNSDIIIEFNTDYEIAGWGGDLWTARININNTTLAAESYQWWRSGGSGGGTRGGVLFPIMGRFINSSLSPINIFIQAARAGSDDNGTFYRDISTWIKITEVSR